MKEKISYLKWRNRIAEIIPEDHRIGTDLLLIDEEKIAREGKLLDCEIFKVDASMALLYDKGTVDFKLNMKSYHIEAPAVLIVLYDQICQPMSYSEDLKCRAIVMSKEFSNSMFANSSSLMPLKNLVSDNPVIDTKDSENAFGMLFDLLLNIAKSPLTEFKLEAAKHLTLSMFYGYSHQTYQYNETKLVNSRKKELYNLFLEKVEAYHKQEREVLFYADKLCVTPKYLSQILKEVSGHTGLEIIEEYTITTCKALLSSTTMSVQQISDEMNFPSQSVFGKYFKRLTGLSPKEYRNTIK